MVILFIIVFLQFKLAVMHQRDHSVCLYLKTWRVGFLLFPSPIPFKFQNFVNSGPAQFQQVLQKNFKKSTSNNIIYRLCCQCGSQIEPNPTNMCVACLRTQVDITEGIPKQGVLYFCRNCERFVLFYCFILHTCIHINLSCFLTIYLMVDFCRYL